MEEQSIVLQNCGSLPKEGVVDMCCYFLVDTYIDEEKGRGMYDDYIRKVKPIVESFGGEYLVRTENITSLHPERNPQRVILIRFPSRQALDACHHAFISLSDEVVVKRIEKVSCKS